MPVTKLGHKQYRWGKHGRVYKTKKAAERQAKAAYANGYGQGLKRKYRNGSK